MIAAGTSFVIGAGEGRAAPRPVLSLGPVTQTTLTLKWEPQPGATQTDHYNVLLDGAKVGETRLGLPNSPTPSVAPTWTFAGLACDSVHSLGLQPIGVNGNGLSKQATLSGVRTSACSSSPPPPPPPADTVRPAKPVLSLGPATASSLTLSWQAGVDNVGVDHYNVFLNGVKVGETTALSWTFTGLQCGTDYSLGLEVEDAAGNTSFLSEATWAPVRTSACSSPPPSVDTSPPSVPTGLVVVSASTTSVTLGWNPSSDNVGVSGYGVYNGVVRVGVTTARTYTVSALKCGTPYGLGVDAYDAAGNRSLLATVTASTAACPIVDTFPPSAPTGLAVSGVTSSSVTLSWNASLDDVGVAGYDRYRGSTLVSSGTGTSYMFSGLSCGTPYTLGVDAYDAALNHSPRVQVSTSTAACTQATLAISPTGSDAASCLPAAPCRSFNRAYQVAGPGTIVDVAGGSYPDQLIQSDGRSASSAYVTFRPVPGASVAVTRLENNASRVEYRDMAIASFYNYGFSGGTQDGVIFRNIDANTFCIGGGRNISVIGGDVGPSLSNNANGQQQPCVAKFPGQTAPAPANVLIEGVRFHDHNAADSAHAECLQVGGSLGLTIRRNTFQRCASTASIHVGRYDANVPSKDVVIENNFFFPNTGASSEPLGDIQYNRSEPGLIIRYNSFAGSGGYSILATFDFHPPATPSAQIYGNAAYAPGHSQPDGYGPCDSLAVYHHNVWRGASCSSTDLNADPRFVSLTDLHLQAGSPAIDRGDPRNYPASDFDGQTRPIGSAPDAGADER
jgi:chitodextrinase